VSQCLCVATCCGVLCAIIVTDMVRPRVHPEGTTATQRVAVSTARLREAGGARKTFRLSPEAYRALKYLMRREQPESETALVEHLLIEAARKARSERG
jgi:hypothetical protein